MTLDGNINIEEVFYCLASLREDFSKGRCYDARPVEWPDMAEEEFVSEIAEKVVVPFVQWLEAKWDMNGSWDEVLCYHLEDNFADAYVEICGRSLDELPLQQCRLIAEKLKLPIKS